MHMGVCTCDMYVATCGVLGLHYKITFYFDLRCYFTLASAAPSTQNMSQIN